LYVTLLVSLNEHEIWVIERSAMSDNVVLIKFEILTYPQKTDIVGACVPLHESMYSSCNSAVAEYPCYYNVSLTCASENIDPCWSGIESAD